jgi:cytochrome c biogenesis protein CcmG/thiol:disulfide interchange protein DsbE
MSEAPAAQAAPRRNWLWVALPLTLFMALAGLFLYKLATGTGDTRIPSALIGKPVPEFTLAALPGLMASGVPVPGFASADLKGKVTVVNVWASWCAPCRQEHPVLVDLARDSRFQVFGLNYKDEPENARRFLGQLGNPFVAVGMDPRGRAGIDWGVYGVPETFVIGKDGTIAFKFVGPLTPDVVRTALLPAIERQLAAAPGS